ncbi:MAG: HAMP domain-containing histidine kinase [bacterium]|nr:HAMP domain-containing histidine kinase [bacterium]
MSSPLSNTEFDSEWLINQVAHALRNPLFAAQMQVQAMMFKVGEQAELTGPAQVLNSQLERLGTMIDDMLLFGRPVQLDLKRESADSLIREAVAEAYSVGDFGETETKISITPNVEVVTCDRRALTTALSRVLVNAFQHSEPPHRVEIQVADDGTNATIEIRDAGEGMTTEMLENATLPFYPQHSGRAGLGLAIAQKLLIAHGGALQLRSTIDEGTTVRCVIPSVETSRVITS